MASGVDSVDGRESTWLVTRDGGGGDGGTCRDENGSVRLLPLPSCAWAMEQQMCW
jgi:hypothetical protein